MTALTTGRGGHLDPQGINSRRPSGNTRRELALALASLVRHGFPVDEAASILGVTPVAPRHPRSHTKSGVPSRTRTPLGAITDPAADGAS